MKIMGNRAGGKSQEMRSRTCTHWTHNKIYINSGSSKRSGAYSYSGFTNNQRKLS